MMEKSSKIVKGQDCWTLIHNLGGTDWDYEGRKRHTHNSQESLENKVDIF